MTPIIHERRNTPAAAPAAAAGHRGAVGRRVRAAFPQLRPADARAIHSRIGQLRARGRRVVAVEVNPRRRLEHDEAALDGVDLVSNRRLPVDRFTVMTGGRVLARARHAFAFPDGVSAPSD